MASVSQAQFEQMTTEGQITHLNSQLDELNGMLGAVTEEPGRSIMTKIADFIKIFLAFTTNIFSQLKQVVGTSQQLVIDVNKVDGKLNELAGAIKATTSDHKTLIDAVNIRIDQVCFDGQSVQDKVTAIIPEHEQLKADHQQLKNVVKTVALQLHLLT